MYTLNTNDVQMVAGGCPACLAVPGGCAVAGGFMILGTYVGYGAAVGYIAGTALLGAASYMLYQKFGKDNAEPTAA